MKNKNFGLNELYKLKDGWYNGEGFAPSKDGLDWLSEIMSKNYPYENNNITLPYYYSSLNNDEIRIEFSKNKIEISLDVNLKTHIAYFHCLNVDNDKIYEQILNLDDKDSWGFILSFMQNDINEHFLEDFDKTLTKEEIDAETFLEWSDETIARAVRFTAEKIKDKMGHRSIFFHSAINILVNIMKEINSDNLEIKIEDKYLISIKEME